MDCLFLNWLNLIIFCSGSEKEDDESKNLTLLLLYNYTGQSHRTWFKSFNLPAYAAFCLGSSNSQYSIPLQWSAMQTGDPLEQPEQGPAAPQLESRKHVLQLAGSIEPCVKNHILDPRESQNGSFKKFLVRGLNCEDNYPYYFLSTFVLFRNVWETGSKKAYFTKGG